MQQHTARVTMKWHLQKNSTVAYAEKRHNAMYSWNQIRTGKTKTNPYVVNIVTDKTHTPPAEQGRESQSRTWLALTRPSAEHAPSEDRLCARQFSDSLNSAINNTLSRFATVFINTWAKGSTTGSCMTKTKSPTDTFHVTQCAWGEPRFWNSILIASSTISPKGLADDS